MSLLNQSTTVQSVLDQLRLHTKLQTFLGLGGVINQPGLTFCNNVQQMLLAKSMAWKFNRKELSGTAGNFFVTQFGVQDYRFAGASAFLLLNPAVTTSNPLPCGGVCIDLATSPVNGGTAAITVSGGVVTVQTIDPHFLNSSHVGMTIYMSGNTQSCFNSVWTFNPATLSSAWTNGWVLTGVPDNKHFTFAATTAQSAGITNVSVTSNVVTVTANNAFVVGQIVNISGLSSASFLNGQALTVLTASPTNFTAAFTHANYGPTADSGNASSTSGAPGINDLSWLESASLTDINSTSFPLPVKPIKAVHRLAPNYMTTGGKIEVCALVDYQNGVVKFRLSEPPSTYCFQINVVYQARAPKLTSPQAVFAWPDNLSYVLMEVALWFAYRQATDISNQAVQLQGQMAQAAIRQALAAEDNEDNTDSLTPEFSFMR